MDWVATSTTTRGHLVSTNFGYNPYNGYGSSISPRQMLQKW